MTLQIVPSTKNAGWLMPLAIVLALALSACGTPRRPIESVSKAEAAVQAADSGKAAEHAPLELDMAREKLARAEQALDDGDHERAQRLADQALVDALLADAKAQSQTSRENAQALQSSIQTLRQETERNVEGVGR